MTPRDGVTRLTGSWRIHEGSAGGWRDPALDDSQWRTIIFPGGYERQGFHARECWVRKNIEIGASLIGRELFFVLGNTRSGYAEVYVNGHLVGSHASLRGGFQSDLNAIDGWRVPGAFVRAGQNTVAIHFVWLTVGYDGIADARILLGKAEDLGPYLARIRSVIYLFEYGAIFLFAFVIVLMAALLKAEWQAGDRYRYVSTIFLVAVGAFYLASQTGLTLLLVPLGADAFNLQIYCSIVLLPLAAIEFVEHYLLGRRTWFRTLTRVVVPSVVIAGIVVGSQRSFLIYKTFAQFMFAVILYLLYLAICAIRRRRETLAPILASALLCMSAAGVHALMGDLGIVHTPPLFHLSVANMVILASAVIIADFVSISYKNKELTTSLTRSNAKLTGALVRAEESTRLKSEFLASISHELRTPLNSIVNIPDGLISHFTEQRIARCESCQSDFEMDESDTIDDSTACPSCSIKGALRTSRSLVYGGQPDETVGFLTAIRNNGRHLLRLVTDLLQFSTLDAGKMQLHPESLPIDDLFREVEATLQPISASKGVSLRFAKLESGHMIWADRVKLLQILLNLTDNAIKFTDSGGTVTISAHESGPNWIMSVADTGIGIRSEHHQVIFESFRQVDAGHTRRYGGTGLGLAITKKLVDLHGGEVWVESELGKGSTFFVRLPVAASGSSSGVRVS